MRVVTVVLLALWSTAALAQTEPVLDLAHLPTMQRPGTEAYRDRFLNENLPRDWAIASNGAYGGAWGGSSLERVRQMAIKNCEAKGGTDCTIYAEGLDIVWHGRAPATVAPPASLMAGRGYGFAPDISFFWHGPQAAKGVVVWGHGYGGPQDDERGYQPPAFIRPLNNAGFDVVRFDRDPTWDHDTDQSTGWLRQGVAELRRLGYRTVVAGGQSRGGWNALEMLRSPGSADAIVTTSAGPGTGTDPGSQILKGETMLYSLAHDVPRQTTRVAYIQFKDDPYGGDKDKRARKMREMVQPNVGALLLIDQPEGFAGHMGAYGSRFSERFGDCILRFVTLPQPPTTCQ